MAAELVGYQPRPASATLVRGRGPRSHELRRLVDHWSAMRSKERELVDKLRARDQEFTSALAQRDECLADEDEADVRGAKTDPKKLERLEVKVGKTATARDDALRRIKTFRPRLVEAENAMAHFAERHAAEISAELLPAAAQAEQRFREVIGRVQDAAHALDDAVFEIDSVQATMQAGERVPTVLGGQVAEMLRAIGQVQGQPLTRLPASLQPLAEEAGMVTQGETGTPIAANLPHPSGPRSMNDRQQAQARRMDSVREVA